MRHIRDTLRFRWNCRSPWLWLMGAALLLSGCSVLGGYSGWLAQGVVLGVAALLAACVPDAATEVPNNPFAKSGPAPVYDPAVLFTANGGDGSAGWVLMGNQAESLGTALALGDINGDGLADLAVGAERYNGFRGRVLVVKAGGTPLNAEFEPGEIPSAQSIELRGDGTNARAGVALAFVGNINNQNSTMEDLAIGMPGDYGTPGTVALVFGSGTHTATEILIDPFLGGEFGGRFLGGYNAGIGNAVGPAGDLNGDGFTDLLIGGRLFTADGLSQRGRAYEARGRVFSYGGDPLWSGGVLDYGNAISGETEFQYMGAAVAGNGDANGDGYLDAAFGMPGAGTFTQGKVWVNLGANSIINGSGNTSFFTGFIFAGTNTYDFTGASLAMADIDGDGKTDLIIAAPGADGVLPGATTLAPSAGTPPARAGRVHVLFGTNFTPGSTILETDLNGSNGFTLVGGEAEEGVGPAVARAGDVNGDGYPDFLITQGHADSAGQAKAYLIFGGPKPFPAVIHLSQLTENQGIVISTTTSEEYSFLSVAGAGDFDGDGVPDIALGWPDYNGYYGRVYMIFGKNFR